METKTKTPPTNSMVIRLPVEFACCFRCSTESIKSKVDDLLLEKLPDETTWLAARDRMLIPVLRNLCRLNNSMSLEWIDLSKPLPGCPAGVSYSEDEDKITQKRILIRFWELCRMTRLSYDVYQTGTQQPDGTFFDAFYDLASSIMDMIRPNVRPISLITTEPQIRERSQKTDDDDLATFTCYQITLIRNHDPMPQTVYQAASSPARLTKHTARVWRSYVKTMKQCGVLDYGLALARNIAGRYEGTMARFADSIQAEIDHEAYKRALLVVSLKDKNATLTRFNTDILRMIVLHTHPVEPVLWEDVLSPFIQHDMLVQI